MKRNIFLILMLLLLILGLVGCGGESQNESNEGTESSEETETNGFSVYNDIVNADYRGIDIEKVFRNPEENKDKTFTIVGKVIESNTDDDNKQHIIFEILTDMYIDGELHEDAPKAEIIYDVEGFGGERMVKDDTIGMTCTFINIKNNDKYGDLPVFNANATYGVDLYLATMSLVDYLDSTGISFEELGLNHIYYEDVKKDEKICKALKKVVAEEQGEQAYADYGMEEEEFNDQIIANSVVFSSESGTYWVVMSNMNGHYDELYIYTGKEEDGKINLEYKSYASTQEMEL